MTKAVTLRLKKHLLDDAEAITREARVPRGKYFNDALAFYNTYTRRRLLKEQLHKESRLVRQSSLEVLEEFEQLEDELLNEH